MDAIEYFKFYRKIFCEDYLKKCPKDSLAYQATLKEKSFYDAAIKALKQEPVCKIRAEIDRQQKWLLQAGYTTYNVDIALDAIKAVVAESEE